MKKLFYYFHIEHFFLIILSVLSFGCINAQNTFYSPESYESKITNQIQNPALVNLSDDYSLGLSYQGRTGLFKNVNTSWLSGRYKLEGQNDQNESLLLLDISNEQVNGFINVNNSFLGYTKSIQLSELILFRMGVNLGLYNYWLKSNNIIPGVSAWSFNGNIGGAIEINQTTVGLGVAQFPNSKVVFVQTENNLKRFGQFNVAQKVQVIDAVELRLDGFLFLGKELQKWQGAIGASYNSLIFGEINYLDGTGLSVTLGIEELKIQKRKLQFGFTSLVFDDQLAVNSNQLFQLSLILK